MNWLQNFIIKLFRIEPAQTKRITIREAESLQANILKNKILYRGDPAEIEQFFKAIAAWDVEKTRFWASVSQGSVRKMHSGIVATVIDRYRDIVVSDMDNVNVEGLAADDWEEIARENKFERLIGKAVAGTLISGDGAFRICTDEGSRYPVLEYEDAENVAYTMQRGRVKEVKFYTNYQKNGKDYRLEEIYGKGYVTYKLYDSDGREKEMNTLDETAGLSDVTFEGDYMMAVPFLVFPSNKYAVRGKALFDGKTDVIDGLDEVISQWLDAVRLGRIKRYIPENLIPRDETTGRLLPANPFDNDFIAIGSNVGEDAKEQINISQPQISYEAYVNSYISFMDLVLQGIISPSTLGIDLKKTDNAESQREKEKVTLYVRGKITDALNEVIPELVDVALKTYDIMRKKKPGEYKAAVKFGEYASPDFDSTVDTIGKAKQFGIISIESSIEQLYGDTWTEEEKAEEVRRIKEEQGIAEMEEPKVDEDAIEIDDNVQDAAGGRAQLNGHR